MKALLFDLDGVLIDSEPVWERVRRAFVHRHGSAWSADVQRRMMGVSTEVWSSALSELIGGEPAPDRVARLVIDEMASEYRRRLPLIEGAADVVQHLARSYPLGIASGSPRSLIELVLELSGLARCFQAVLSSDEISRGKPAPDPYRELARRLGVEPAACVAIEDSSNGLRSAIAAGALVVAIPPRANMPDPELLAKAAAVLDDIRQLTPELLDGLDGANR